MLVAVFGLTDKCILKIDAWKYTVCMTVPFCVKDAEFWRHSRNRKPAVFLLQKRKMQFHVSALMNSAFYWTRTLITVLKELWDHHTLHWVKWIRYSTSHPIYFNIIFSFQQTSHNGLSVWASSLKLYKHFTSFSCVISDSLTDSTLQP